MGSDSDLPVMEKAFEVFDSFDAPYEVKILSAHRTPKQHTEYSASAEKRGLKVIIAAAGGAAHLPGVTAAHTTLPVIGVPIKSKALNGMDSLLSMFLTHIPQKSLELMIEPTLFRDMPLKF